ncbi:MAG: hypothetical protein BMS9Abin10_0132 [Gammaproteobacteria bacterium]|nr:MAG: hypothetical protein BMS9Abin10_0132 [Gammaproteobacteria bacterium]
MPGDVVLRITVQQQQRRAYPACEQVDLSLPGRNTMFLKVFKHVLRPYALRYHSSLHHARIDARQSLRDTTLA